LFSVWRHAPDQREVVAGFLKDRNLSRSRWRTIRRALIAVKKLSSELTAKRFELRAAGLAEIAKQVDPATVDHLSQFKEGLA
jgi:hypothetical protein